MMEQVDVGDLKSPGRKPVPVRVRLRGLYVLVVQWLVRRLAKANIRVRFPFRTLIGWPSNPPNSKNKVMDRQVFEGFRLAIVEKYLKDIKKPFLIGRYANWHSTLSQKQWFVGSNPTLSTQLPVPLQSGQSVNMDLALKLSPAKGDSN